MSNIDKGEQNYVAWCRYVHRGDDTPTIIELCDSDDDGAFKVYRHQSASVPRMPTEAMLESQRCTSGCVKPCKHCDDRAKEIWLEMYDAFTRSSYVNEQPRD